MSAKKKTIGMDRKRPRKAAKKTAKKAAAKKARPRSSNAKKARAGRPSLYRDEFARHVEILCRLGATDAELAEFFEVCERTINSWKSEHPAFGKSLRLGKMMADAEVADGLFKRATGYTHKALKFATFEGQITDAKEFDKHYPPDTVACIFWLKNRRPDLWREKITAEVTGRDGKPMELTISPEMLAAIEAASAIAATVQPPGCQR